MEDYGDILPLELEHYPPGQGGQSQRVEDLEKLTSTCVDCKLTQKEGGRKHKPATNYFLDQ